MKSRISTERRKGGLVYLLHDDETGARASILPSFGFNLFDLRLPAAGKPRRIIVAEPDWEDAPQKAGRNGIPILFPFPNRIKDGAYSFGGKDYQLPINSKPHAIHGFAIQADWDVIEHGTDDAGAFLKGRYQISKHSPEMLKHWPTDAILDVRYSLLGRVLNMEINVTNPTANPLPYGFGIHPYFRLPLDPGADPAKTEVYLPAGKTWVLEGYIPTGERKPVDERLDFRKWRSFHGLQLDDVLTDVEHFGNFAWCVLRDSNLNVDVTMDFDRTFRELVVFTPPGSPDEISIEPYTQTTDAINLAAREIDGGLRILEHGQHERLRLHILTGATPFRIEGSGE